MYSSVDMVKNAASSILAAIPISAYLSFVVSVGVALIGVYFVSNLIKLANSAAAGNRAFLGDKRSDNNAEEDYDSFADSPSDLRKNKDQEYF